MNVIVSEGTLHMSSKDLKSAPRVRRLTVPGTLAAALPEWDGSALGAGALTPMQTRAWIMACAETLPRSADLDVVVIEDEQGVAAVAPLVQRKEYPPVSELLGLRELGEPSDFIYRDESALAALIDLVAPEAGAHRASTGPRLLTLGGGHPPWLPRCGRCGRPTGKQLSTRRPHGGREGSRSAPVQPVAQRPTPRAAQGGVSGEGDVRDPRPQNGAGVSPAV